MAYWYLDQRKSICAVGPICSNCGEIGPMNESYFFTKRMKFCPFCGAEMVNRVSDFWADAARVN